MMKKGPYFRRWCSMLMLSALVATLIGCGSGTHSVSGTITLNGEPMSGGGDIQFIPIDGERNPAGGVIDEDGNYTLGTFSTDDGALPGKYRVQIVQNEVLQSAKYEATEPPAEGEPEVEGADTLIQKEILVPENELISKIYTGPKSTLTATVESGDNVIDFDVSQ